jgi:ATP-dependent helicase/nuclease subunit B
VPRADPIVLTPAARLARALEQSLARQHLAAGPTAWRPPRILTFGAWLGVLRDEWLLAGDDDRVPIDASQSLALWQSIIERDVFVGEPDVATLAQRAWRLVHENALTPPEHWPSLQLSEDSRRFRAWAGRYRSLCEERRLLDEWTFAAELPAWLRTGRLGVPATIELAGFALPASPLATQILAAAADAGATVTRRDAPKAVSTDIPLMRFDTADDELAAAAHWARAMLEEAPERSIAIVVPDLPARVERAERILRSVFDPPAFAIGPAGPEPFHLSLGRPLADWPLVGDALACLALDPERLPQPRVRSLLRSPYLPAFIDERSACERALATLARDAPFEITTYECARALRKSGAAATAARLEGWRGARARMRNTARSSVWAAQFQVELTALGLGAGRPLDSREYQTLVAWHELLEALGRLDVVTPEPLTREDAIARLTERARGRPFREQNVGVPLEVLGVEEALGATFDALWITTLDRDTWPGAPRRDPLVPAVVQAALPWTTTEGCLARAREELAALLAAAPVVHGSFARGSEDIARNPTALLVHGARSDAPPAALPAAASMSTSEDDTQAPAFTAGRVAGGTGVLRNQSDCPFRAFAERRLGAFDPTPPRPGLDPRLRGQVVHHALEAFWEAQSSRAELVALGTVALERAIADAVTSSLDDITADYRLTLSTAGRALEQRRVEAVLARWLAIERERSDFVVIAREERLTLDFAGLSMTGKIDRLDRLADGSTLLIDYKTGQTRSADWDAEARIADPQLPAYAVTLTPPPAAIAFARLKADALAFDGIAAADIGTSGVAAIADDKRRFAKYGDWDALLAAWRRALAGLATDFVSGHAAVDPRKPAVCERCHLHALCRIDERAPYAALDVEADDG